MPTNALLITLASFAALAAAYVLYGRFLARRVFQLDSRRTTPAHELEDGVDYIPTRVPVLFGHHFASIAGLGPILGPAIAVIWGWLPAVLWAVLGSIFVGAVHDLGALTVSLRFKGRSIGDVCRELVGPRSRLLFLLIIFFLMSLAMGAFVSAISELFVRFRPDAIIPSFGLMVVAMVMGVAVYKLRAALGLATLVALVAFAGLIVLGVAVPVNTYDWVLGHQQKTAQREVMSASAAVEAAASADRDSAQLRLDAAESREAGIEEALTFLPDARHAKPVADVMPFEPPYGAASAIAHLEATGRDAAATAVDDAAKTAKMGWIWGLLAYGFLASVLPVWLLLQPRDYINSFQLYAALGLMVAGLCGAALVGAPANHIDAAPIRDASEFTTDADRPPLIFPFLFVTIACGAVSGFHSLVSSGTTVRQLNRETDALPIGFGAMLTEGALAVLVIMACVAGLGVAAWQPGGAYSSWGGIKGGGLGVQLGAVVDGGANFLTHTGLSLRYAQAFLAVTIVAFAMTTLDSATRLLRFNVEEIFRSLGLGLLANRYIGSAIAVAAIAFFALSSAGSELWVMFGTTNQLLAGLTLLTVTIFLFKLRRPVLFTLIPMVAMLIVSLAAMVFNLVGYLKSWEENAPLIVVSVIVLTMTIWLIIEAAISFSRGRDDLHIDGEPPIDHQPEDEAAVHSHLG